MQRAIFLLVLFIACQRGPKHEDTPTSGHIKIAVDVAVQPVIEAQLEMFHHDYKRAKIEVEYLPEAKCVEKLLQDSVRLIIITRPLNKEEEQVLKAAKLIPRPVKLAYEAVALIVHPDNPQYEFSVEEIKQILKGEQLRWANGDTIQVVVDNNASGIVQYLKDSLLQGAPFGENTYAIGSIKEVVDYVAEHPNALGFVPLCWISDKDEKTPNTFLSKIKLCAVGTQPGQYYEPYQAWIYQRKYPFIRPIYSIKREPYMGLGSGFEAFLTGGKGQRIFWLHDLIPAHAPIRLVEIKEQNLLEEEK